MRRFIPLVLACLVLPLACSEDAQAPADAGADGKADASPSGETPNETAGSRLRPVYRKTSSSDGAYIVEPVAWLDTKLDEYCRYGRATDGAFRCLPVRDSEADVYFGDAACADPTKTVYAFSRSAHECAWPRLDAKSAWMSVPTSLPNDCVGEEIHRMPESARVYPALLYSVVSGVCKAITPPIDHAYYVFSQLPLVAADQFVRLTVSETTGVSSARVKPIFQKYAGDDGSAGLLPEALFDSQRGFFCTPARAVDGVLRCLPPLHSWTSSAFMDAACTNPARVLRLWDACTADVRQGAFLGEGVMVNACYASRVRALPNSAIQTSWFTKDAVICKAVTGQKGQFALDETDVLAQPEEVPQNFAEIVEADRPWTEADGYGKPGSRLKLIVREYTTADGAHVTRGNEFSDTGTAGGACDLGGAEDGKLRCLPSDPHVVSPSLDSSSGYFADVACTQAVWGYAKKLCQQPTGGTVLATESGTFQGCSITRVATIPPVTVTPAKLYRFIAGVCALQVTNPADYYLFPLAQRTPVLPADLAALTLEYLAY